MKKRRRQYNATVLAVFMPVLLFASCGRPADKNSTYETPNVNNVVANDVIMMGDYQLTFPMPVINWEWFEPGTQTTVTTTPAAQVRFTQPPVSSFKFRDGNSALGRGHVVINGYTGSEPYIKLVASYNGKPVEGIDSAAFANSSIKGVCIPNGIAFIGSCAFNNCKQLESVVFEGSVTEMESSVFMGCAALQELTFPGGLKRIEDFMCSGCSALRSVTISNTVTSIDSCAFGKCADGMQITIPASVTFIHENAFLGTGNVQIIAPNGSYAQQYAQKLAAASQTATKTAPRDDSNTPTRSPMNPGGPTATMPSTTRPSKTCSKCHGTGLCQTCGGTHLMRNPWLGGSPEDRLVCPNCSHGECSRCGGTGRIG